MRSDQTTLKHTKILATVGPATNSPEMLAKIIDAGVNGLRMNFSHGDYAERDEQIALIREISEQIGRNVAILQDLQGPKIRLGMLKDDMRYEVKKDDELELTYGIEHDGGANLPSQYDLAEKVKVGETVFLFDGKIRTVVLDIYGETVKVRAENDGFLMSKKAINLPDTDFGGDVLTKKDMRDIEYGVGQDFDYVALSFVQTANDVNKLREILRSKGSDARIVTKVETKQAILPENLEAIVEASDGVMVARGDLAVEAGAEIVPVVQRKIIELCQKHCKFSIVATQMMASMVDAPEPTRAEVSDVANAVIQGADVVMLSDETANGSFPVEAVTAMRKTILRIQNELPIEAIFQREGSDERRDAIAASAVVLAEEINADAIIVETRTGAMARNVAIHRPNRPIIAVSNDQRVAQQMALIYATRGFYTENPSENYGLNVAEQLNRDEFFINKPATVVVVKSSDAWLEGGVADTIRIKALS